MIAFDQFKGRKTDFTMDHYSVTMPQTVSAELQARADRVEADINSKQRGKRAHSSDKDEESIIDNTEEERYGTAVPQGARADEKKVFGNMAAEVEEVQIRNPSTNLKKLLFESLADKTGEESNALAVPSDLRSRVNSLRNGETSKVIENLGIEAPKMDKEQIEEYLRFKALKNSQ